MRHVRIYSLHYVAETVCVCVCVCDESLYEFSRQQQLKRIERKRERELIIK